MSSPKVAWRPAQGGQVHGARAGMLSVSGGGQAPPPPVSMSQIWVSQWRRRAKVAAARKLTTAAESVKTGSEVSSQ